MFRVVNLTTGETLLESNNRVSVGVEVNGEVRGIITANRQSVSTYLRDLMRDRADIKTIRGRFSLHNRMEL